MDWLLEFPKETLSSNLHASPPTPGKDGSDKTDGSLRDNGLKQKTKPAILLWSSKQRTLCQGTQDKKAEPNLSGKQRLEIKLVCWFSALAKHSQRPLGAESPLLGGLNPELYKGEPSESGDEVEYPDGHIGRLWLGLDYDPTSERLAVTLVKARNLPSRTLGSNNSCDPFVR
ncbi:SYT15 [Cordylochernes scorpioides]|uniref:SYT15 n=1 Tax=Cordylochernes scorpioides TaxID=51811 RepID=A0ABY6LQ09_9ARAC|nr:SYT15 [Cordylochernes scorpioides]